jgi:hypothetical protein
MGSQENYLCYKKSTCYVCYVHDQRIIENVDFCSTACVESLYCSLNKLQLVWFYKTSIGDHQIEKAEDAQGFTISRLSVG